MENKFEDEIDFKDVLTNPKRWFGMYYILLIVGIVLGGVYYLKNINYIYMNDVNSSVYLPDSVAIDESAEFMLDAASKEIYALNEDKSAMVKSVIVDLNQSYSNKSWFTTINNLDKAVTIIANNSSWKSNKEVFLRLITSNIGQNGFTSDFAELSNEEVNDFYNTMIMLFSKTNESV